MTRAEEAALKAYPVDIQLFVESQEEPGKWLPVDENIQFRYGYEQGYEQAVKETIERAIAWLKENANKYIVDIGVGYGEHGRNVELVVGGMCWEHLQQELEESHD